jgi:hypothetical protein
MKESLLISVFLAVAISCNPKHVSSELPQLIDLVISDSIRVHENDFFLNGQGQIKIVGDSLIAVSSIKNSAIGFINIRNGKQIAQISASDFPEAPFFPSSFDIADFPILYVADRFSNSIYKFDALEKRFLLRIKPQLPTDKVVKAALGEFHKTKIGFLIELSASNLDIFHPDYYKQSKNLIYLFDNNGDSLGSFLEYPEIFQKQQGTIFSQNYLSSSYSNNSFLYSYPHEKIIRRSDDTPPFSISMKLELPLSRYFDFDLKDLDKIVTFDELQNSADIPRNDYFNSIIENEKAIYFQTWLIGDESKGLNRTSHLLIYNKKEKQWSETSNPRNILDIGMLAGVVNDTLYFYEGSLMKSDEKYIKRAVLKPIEE